MSQEQKLGTTSTVHSLVQLFTIVICFGEMLIKLMNSFYFYYNMVGA